MMTAAVKVKRKKLQKVSVMADGSQSRVMTSLLNCIRGDASAARSRESAPVATVNRAVTTTTTERQPSPISQQ